MSHRQTTSRGSQPSQLKSTGQPSRPTTLAAPKPVRPVQNLLQPPAQQCTGRPSPPGYTSFPPPPSPAPAVGADGPCLPPTVSSANPSKGSTGTGPRIGFRSPGPNALTSFPPPPPTPPQRDAAGYISAGVAPPTSSGPPPKSLKPASSTVQHPSKSHPIAVTAKVLATPEKPKSCLSVSETELRPGTIAIENLEENLHNLRFAPSPILSTIYSVPSTPREELSTPDFTASTTSCFTPPSTNPTPEPMVLTPRLPPPTPKEPVTSPTRPRANSRRTTPPSRKRGRGVVSCIDTVVTFPTTWYIHSAAPNFYICSRCYEDHLYGTRFENDFKGKIYDDKKPRVCRFSKPRVRDHLLQQVLITGRIEDLISFLRHRSSILDCRGVNGVHGSEGTKWYRPKNNAVPNMVVCQACYEDHIQPFRSAANFEPTSAQPANDVWSCDLAIPYIKNMYRLKAAQDNDWATFTTEAVARMNISACAKRQKVAVGSRRWFAPTTGMPGVLICAACYCDHVAWSGEEHRWKDAGDNLASRYGSMVYCALGHFNVGIAMSRAQETKDFSIFWKALDIACHEEFCDPQGIKDGSWYTFPSHPEEFGICATCVATIAEPLGLASSLVRKCGVPPRSTYLCSFNPASPRFLAYMTKLLEGFYIADTRPLDSYALEFASLPLCPRDEDFKNRRWYGWQDCTICPSCYHEFARGTALAACMPLKGETVPGSLMCEMYSPRMRSLYTEACERSPPSPANLLKASKARRAVYFETVPVIRQMILEAQAALGHQRRISSASRAMGQIQDISMKSSFVYDLAGAGNGSANTYGIKGALYGTQASSIAAEFGSGTRTLVMEKLEKRWSEVE
ncbi:uncharacterized protein CTRU02_205148 [Colletotrichum truncatum]|uniref:Integral membrane protein n=1 Tax=Colletotrichum truncatum TaxID=5467 RepID=A0ACC3Z373_COLTU|nr:uncharacterized protein CTRU02_06030 [Colletotrichum truncatum]KAF6793158.1 integral membrane protein [Colletotrichum truncatum]